MVAIGVIACARVEVAPGCILGDRGHHVVLWLVEVEVIIFVEENGHGSVAFDCSAETDHFGDALGVFDAVAVDQEEVGSLDHV